MPLRYIISERWVYRDQFSREYSTNKIKIKYKIFVSKHSIFDEIFIFYPTTSSKYYDDENYVVVESCEWERKIDPKYLKKTSYIDICNPSSENEKDIINKWNSRCFPCVAKMPDIKFNEIFTKLKAYKGNSGRYKQNKMVIVEMLRFYNDKLKDMGIAS